MSFQRSARSPVKRMGAYKQRDDNRPENLELWARGSQPPGARVSDLLVEGWRVILLYGGTFEVSLETQAMPPLAREITRR